jgi:uncharacterized protein (TIGR00297 family)
MAAGRSPRGEAIPPPLMPTRPPIFALVALGAALGWLGAEAGSRLYTFTHHTIITRPSLPPGRLTHRRFTDFPRGASAAPSLPAALAPRTMAVPPPPRRGFELELGALPTVDLDATASWPAAVGVSTTLFGLGVASGRFERVLTPLLPNPFLSGVSHAWLLSVILWATLGWQGWSVCVVYLFLGVAVTKVRSKEKEAAGIAEGRGGARGPENVWGSAATAAACALLATAVPSQLPLLALGYVASLATKLSDTCGSEIGKAYGKTPILITTLQPVPPGTEGAVSVEGTVAGIVGSAVLALFAVAIGLLPLPAVGIVLVAAFIACNFESFLGATYQGKVAWLTNEVVNAINTTVGAAVAMAAAALLAAAGLPVAL